MPAKRKTTGQQFIRNVRHVQVSLRLGTGRRIELKPRGQRGDTVPVNKDEMVDEIFLGNVGILFEVIPQAEATKIIEKQTTNQQSLHPALAQMRNALGEEYKRAVVVEEHTTESRPVVAAVNDRGEITRFRAPGSVDNPLPEIPADVPAEEAQDWLARQKTVEGPEAGLAPGIKVVKGTPETTTPKENN